MEAVGAVGAARQRGAVAAVAAVHRWLEAAAIMEAAGIMAGIMEAAVSMVEAA